MQLNSRPHRPGVKLSSIKTEVLFHNSSKMRQLITVRRDKVNIATTVIVYVLFIGILIYQIKCLRDLLVPTKKNMDQVIFTVIGIVVILGITYFYGNGLTHYILGILAAIVFGLFLITPGITSKGFSYSISYKGFLAPWHKIKRVRINLKEDVIVSFSGHGSYKLYFKKKDYKELLSVLKQNLSSEVLKEM